MSWARSRPNGQRVNPRYREPEYLATNKRLRLELKTAGTGTCAELICLAPTRLIRHGMDLHLCHDRTTGKVLGLGHADCNRKEAARYARAQQTPTTQPKPWTRTNW